MLRRSFHVIRWMLFSSLPTLSLISSSMCWNDTPWCNCPATDSLVFSGKCMCPKSRMSIMCFTYICISVDICPVFLSVVVLIEAVQYVALMSLDFLVAYLVVLSYYKSHSHCNKSITSGCFLYLSCFLCSSQIMMLSLPQKPSSNE